MTKCLLCLEAVDIVNHDGLCEDCVDYVESMEREEYTSEESEE